MFGDNGDTFMAVRRVLLEAHFAPEVHALLKRAAEIEGRSLTDFVVAAGSTAARRTIEHAQIIRLGAESSEFSRRSSFRGTRIRTLR